VIYTKIKIGSMKYKTCGEETNISGMSFYNCDNIKLLKETPDNYYSLCIVDPPRLDK